MAHVTIANVGSIKGGVMPMTEVHGDAPPYWLPYYTVASCDGRALAGSMDLEAGPILAVMVPQDAAFAVFEGETDD